jgi:hypothetical protein
VRGIQDLVRVLTGLPDRFEVCYEASCGYGRFHDLLRPLAARPGGASGATAADLPVLCGVAAYVTTRRFPSRIRTLAAG